MGTLVHFISICGYSMTPTGDAGRGSLCFYMALQRGLQRADVVRMCL